MRPKLGLKILTDMAFCIKSVVVLKLWYANIAFRSMFLGF